jgi:hypothetical protein
MRAFCHQAVLPRRRRGGRRVLGGFSGSGGRHHSDRLCATQRSLRARRSENTAEAKASDGSVGAGEAGRKNAGRETAVAVARPPGADRHQGDPPEIRARKRITPARRSRAAAQSVESPSVRNVHGGRHRQASVGGEISGEPRVCSDLAWSARARSRCQTENQPLRVSKKPQRDKSGRRSSCHAGWRSIPAPVITVRSRC